MKIENWIVCSALLIVSPILAAPAQPAATPPVIEGTWRMVSFRYGDTPLQKVAPGRIMLKHVTPSHFTWVDYADKGRKVSRMAGGTFTFKDGEYTEAVEYGTGEDIQPLLGKPQVFHDTVTSKTWSHKGKLSMGLDIEENWVRVPAK